MGAVRKNSDLQDSVRRSARLMIIDDESTSVEVVRAHLLEAGFRRIIATTDAAEGLTKIGALKPNVVLLDINMPIMSGLELLEALRNSPERSNTRVIVVSSLDDPKVKLQALRLGAADFLSKPVDPSELVLRLQNVLMAQAHQFSLAKYAEQLEERVRRRTTELEKSRKEALHVLAKAGEYRDDDTGHHVARVGRYSAIIATELGFTEEDIELLEQAAQLHDMGKIGIPDSVLHKPGKLDSVEFELIQEHCEIGRRILSPHLHESSIRLASFQRTDSMSPVLRMAAVIAGSHHEKWDGSGYPKGLSGQSIPIVARIVAVADVFDALSSARPYKEAFPVEKCLGILEEGRGTHFDPTILDAFFARMDEILCVRESHSNLETTSTDIAAMSSL